MIRPLISAFLFLVVSVSAVLADSSVTLYRDGTVFERDTTIQKSVIDIPLASGMLTGTLRVIPVAGTEILGVEILPSLSNGKSTQEVDSLIEQKQRLEDRLLALATREEIFTAAAKSQSGKAPRKSKTNPDPLQNIRQGTDFAIAQLEAVYTSRRKTEQEIKRLATRIAESRKGNFRAESKIRIMVAQPRGRVIVRYATSNVGWQPRYNLYLTSNSPTARMVLSTRIDMPPTGYLVRVSSGSIADSGRASTVTVTHENRAQLADYQLQISDERFDDSIYTRFSGKVTNPGTHYLPAGESGLYRNGVYLGRFRFSGLSSGKSAAVSLGI
jgi:hypothetical protein